MASIHYNIITVQYKAILQREIIKTVLTSFPVNSHVLDLLLCILLTRFRYFFFQDIYFPVGEKAPNLTIEERTRDLAFEKESQKYLVLIKQAHFVLGVLLGLFGMLEHFMFRISF